MFLSGSQTVKQILRQRPIAVEALEQALGARIWERMETPIATLCAAAGADSYALVEKLASLPPAPAEADWERKPAYWLVDRLIQDHVAFREIEMPAIMALLEEERMPAYPDGYVLKLLLQEFRHFQDDFSLHMAEEEEFLFPKILRTEASLRYPDLYSEVFKGSVRMYMPVQAHGPDEAFHDLIGGLNVRLRALTADLSGSTALKRTLSALEAFEQRLRAHIYIEGRVLLPRAVAMETSLMLREG